MMYNFLFFFSSRRRHTRSKRDWSSDVCSSDLEVQDAEETKQIIDRHNVTWIVSYDADRVAENSAQILGNPVPQNALCYLLDRSEERRVGKECRSRWWS